VTGEGTLRLDAGSFEFAGGKVVLLGHSMGGLVTRWYIDDPDRAQKVARAVTLGGVYWGAPKALFPLAAGLETPLPSILNDLTERRAMQEFARDLQGSTSSGRRPGTDAG
jgi:triacylglycerol esterase/lipase EstA (alpha/beta hydrolase family)